MDKPVERLLERGADCIFLTIDADAFEVAHVPGVSAPNLHGLPGAYAYEYGIWAGRCGRITSMEVVEINPGLDRDGQSARWGALVVWNFLIGLALRKPV
jgi:arginase family enzyme